MNIYDVLLARQLSGGGKAVVELDGEITCTDDGEGNVTITITEGNDNG